MISIIVDWHVDLIVFYHFNLSLNTMLAQKYDWWFIDRLYFAPTKSGTKITTKYDNQIPVATLRSFCDAIAAIYRYSPNVSLSMTADYRGKC